MFGGIKKLGKKIFGGAKKAVKGVLKVGKSLLNPKTLISAGIGFFTGDWKTAIGLGLSALDSDYTPAAKILAAKRYEKLPEKAMYEWGGIPFIGKNTLAAHMKEVDLVEQALSEQMKHSEWEQEFEYKQKRYEDYVKALEKILNISTKTSMPIDLGVPEEEAPMIEGSWFDYKLFD